MKINTRDFGTIDVEPDALYDFPEGVYGFEEDTKFAVFEKSFGEVSFIYLQSVINVIPCFLVFNPVDFYPGYSPLISKEDLAACQTDNIEDLIFLVIAAVPDSVEELSLNIKSPIVLNPKIKVARQVILQNPEYTVKYQPFLNGGKAGASC